MRPVHTIAALLFSSAFGFASSASPQAPEDFAVLAGVKVTCTDSTVRGNVGVANSGTIVTTRCNITGEARTDAQTAYETLLGDYQTYKNPATRPACNFSNVPLAGAYLLPGVYCYDAAVTVTNSTLTLVGSASDTWTFVIGTKGTGALTGTGFTVAVTGGATCDNNVLWWAAQGATLTDSAFTGSILAGADITITRGGVTGQLLAGGAGTAALPTGEVTMTGTTVNFCGPTPPPPPPVPALIPVFVIGDSEDHAIGDTVNFWGAQWWKNNVMSGPTIPGASRASFKGFATSDDFRCGGSWQSLPGNSSSPPATLAPDIAVIATSNVIKNGPNLGGDIKEIVFVQVDPGYGPNPGHAGTGKVTSVYCAQ